MQFRYPSSETTPGKPQDRLNRGQYTAFLPETMKTTLNVSNGVV